jgi:response regulator RpfG family c-di-GMP phosphodiesterase
VIRTLRQGEGKQWDATLVERFLQLVDQADATSRSEVRTAG